MHEAQRDERVPRGIDLLKRQEDNAALRFDVFRKAIGVELTPEQERALRWLAGICDDERASVFVELFQRRLER